MPLPLRADSSGDANLAARFDGHARAFVRTDACAFHITRDAETDVLALRPKSRLLSLDERVVTDQLRRLIERRPIVSAVVDQWPRILKHDLVIVRKPIGSEEVLSPNLDPIDPELARCDIQ